MRAKIEIEMSFLAKSLLILLSLFPFWIASLILSNFFRTTNNPIQLAWVLVFIFSGLYLLRIAFIKWKIDEEIIEINSIFYKKIIKWSEIVKFKEYNLGFALKIEVANHKPIFFSHTYFQSDDSKKFLERLELKTGQSYSSIFIRQFLGRKLT